MYILFNGVCMENILQEFKNSVVNHQLTINLDHGLYRDITVKNPESSVCAYHVISRPRYLMICGDMGTFVFNVRANDAFEYFRNNLDNIRSSQYYRSKLQSEDISVKSTQFDFEGVLAQLDEYLQNFLDYYLECPENKNLDYEMAKAAVERFRTQTDRNEYSYVEAINNWDEYEAGGMSIDDFWDGNTGLIATYHYKWCIYAIIHAVNLYNLSLVDQNEISPE